VHLLGRVHLRHHQQVGPRDARQVLGAAGLVGIDAHGGDCAGFPPQRERLRRELSRLRSQLGRREILELEDQHIGTAARGPLVRRCVGARHEKPAAPR
jgi:hypothetical protein